MKCYSCGHRIGDTWQFCSKCGKEQPVVRWPGRRSRNFGKLLLILFGVLLLLAIIAHHETRTSGSGVTTVSVPLNPSETSIKTGNNSGPATNPPPSSAESRPPVMPDQESALVRILEDYAARYEHAGNELQQSTLRTDRGKDISRILPNRSISNWVGTLAAMETTHDGNGIVSISLPSAIHVRVETLNNDLLGVGSLIPHGSELYSRVSGLSVGDVVIFSGIFGEDKKDYISELSMTERGSMTDPEVLFRFSDIRKPDQSPLVDTARETVDMAFEFTPPDRDGLAISPPVILEKVAPEYSDEARRVDFNGKVAAIASLDFNGNVDFVRVMESPGIGLTQNVEAALQKWKFRPATKAGQPVPSRVSVVFTFSRSE